MGKMFDFSETEAVKFELLPEGTYNAKVYDYELKTSSNGNKMINFEFQITDEKFKTKKAWYLQVVEGKSKPYWLGLLETLSGLTKEEIKNQDDSWPAYKKYFMHGTSHFIGLDVHDVGLWHEPIRAGMVFTVEPGIYIREENIGIRLENDIVITENGYRDLMADIPLEIEEIEELMA